MPLQAAIIPVTPFQQNCSLWWDSATGRGVVVDPGGDVEQILAAINQVKLTVEAILLTHGHLDHAGGAAELREALLGTMIIGPDQRDSFLLEGITEQAQKYNIAARPITPDRWLAEGDQVEIGGEAFDVLHCPGHTPGHIVFVSKAQRLAIVGDVLFRGSVGRTDFPYGDHAALIASITEKLLPLGDDIRFLCGHGPASSFGEERRTNPFLS